MVDHTHPPKAKVGNIHGIRFSRSSNYSFQMAGGGRKNIHEYVGIGYTANEGSMFEI
jgi:hypothetical protein